MIVESLATITILLSGVAIARVVDIRGWILPFIGFVIGLALLIGVGSLLIIIPWVPTWPILIYSLTAVISLSIWVFFKLKGRDVSVELTPLLFTVVVAILLVAIFRYANMVNWHIDGFFYMEAGSLIADNNYALAGGNFAERRLLSTSIMHSVAHLSGEFYLRSITPLLSISTLIIFVWLFKECARRYISRNTFIAFSVIGLMLLVTNNRYLFHSFNINSHLLFATLTLLIVVSGWLLVNKNVKVSQQALKLIQTISIPAFIVSRPEAAIVACVILLPTLLSKHISNRYRFIVLSVLGLSIILWYGFVIGSYIYRGGDISFSALGSLVLGFMILLSAPILNSRLMQNKSKYILWLTEAGIWLALVGLTIRDPAIFSGSISATVENILFGAGSWGSSLIMLMLLLVGVLVFRKFQNQIYIRFAITTFFPLGFLFAYMRDGAYRVGTGDSLSRMFIHIVPLMVLYIILAIAIGEKTHTKEDSFKLSKSSNPVQ